MVSFQKYADDFYKNFNGINYNSLESDMCHLAYVAKIETMKASEVSITAVDNRYHGDHWLKQRPLCIFNIHFIIL